MNKVALQPQPDKRFLDLIHVKLNLRKEWEQELLRHITAGSKTSALDWDVALPHLLAARKLNSFDG